MLNPRLAEAYVLLGQSYLIVVEDRAQTLGSGV